VKDQVTTELIKHIRAFPVAQEDECDMEVLKLADVLAG
jgi:hypothetical protein